MSLEIVYGESRDRIIAGQLAATLQSVMTEGTAYLGYPVLATADEPVYIDALLVSQDHGLVAFQIAEGVPHDEEEWLECFRSQDRLYGALDSHLGRHESLRQGRRLALDIETVTVFPNQVTPPEHEPGSHFCSIEELPALVEGLSEIPEPIFVALQAALQRVTTIKPNKRRTAVRRANSRGAILKDIERGIANLDQWQKQAAIESPDGPQRIRGLAGSGKTIVLALKAAYLHSQHPDWHIVVTFQSRALYQQFEDLITRFTFETNNEPPDFQHLHILHAWGASGRDGVYKSIARVFEAPFRDFNYAASTFGRDQAFRGICRELLDLVEESDPHTMYNAVLIDEAQDLPPEFFKLVYRVTDEPKRIVWAYDELQNLSESEMPTTAELFGTTDDGEEVISLSSGDGEARRDIVLPVCYRNPPWSLATAHALGFGIYRTGGLVQYFDDPSLWQRIGYEIKTGTLQPNRRVVLDRSPTSYPPYFHQLLTPSDAVVLKKFETESEENAWIAEQIETNLTEDELEYDDILVVLPDAFTSKRRSSRLASALAQRDISSHLVGVSNSVDEVFLSNSIAMAHIYRAKGNEAPMVYVLDAQYAAGTGLTVSRRNTIFTAITRSRAWVRICGWGDAMDSVKGEVEKVRSNNYQLSFKVPTATQLETIRRIHRDRSDEEILAIEQATQSIAELMKLFEAGDLDLADLPPQVKTQIVRLAASAVDADVDQ